MMAANKKDIKWWTKMIHSHCIETSLSAKPIDARDLTSATKFLVNTKFMSYGILFCVHRLKFNNNIFPRQDVLCKVCFAYRSWIKCDRCNTIALDSPNEPKPILLCSLYLPSIGIRCMEFSGEKEGDSSECSVLDIRQEVNDTAMYKSGWYKGVSEINHKSHVDINDVWIWRNILMAGLHRHCTLFTICSRNLCSKDYMQYNTWRCLGILFEIVTGLRERRGKELFLCDDSYAVHSGKFRCLLHLQRLKARFPSAHGSSGQ